MERVQFQHISSRGTHRLPLTGIEQWDQEGVLHLKKFIPDELIDAYVSEREVLLGKTDKWRTGWNDPCPYLRVPTMRALALHAPLTTQLGVLIGSHVAGLHLCLSGFQSTERAWHQDRYLNPEYVGEHYIAAWIALDDVRADSGPFEYIPGSHRWPVIERSKVWSQMRVLGQNPDLPTWPSDSEGWVGQACENEIEARQAPRKAFLGEKGDVLLWHASLVHRGSKPIDKTLERRALICHYSSIDHRPDMHSLKREGSSYYFDFPEFHSEPSASTHRS